MFISLEGIDGSGKTGAIKSLSLILKAKGYAVISTREPGGCPIAEEIRKIIFKQEIVPLAEAYMFAASREQHIEEVILPALKQGYIVLSDRYYGSSIAFQRFGRKLSPAQVPVPTLLPDVSYLLDIPLDISLQRLAVRAEKHGELNRLDKETYAFKLRVYEGYQWLLKNSDACGPFVRIDATQPPVNVVQDILSDIEKRLRGDACCVK